MIPDEAQKLLKGGRIGYLCTSGPKNQPHITPIFAIYDCRTYRMYFQAKRASKKVKDIIANPNVSLTIDSRDPLNPFNNEGVMIQGDAELLEADLEKSILGEGDVPDDIIVAIDTFKSDFADVVSKGKSTEKVVIKVKTRKMVYWRGPKFQKIEI